MMASMDLGAQGVSEELTDLAGYVKERIWQDPLAADLQWSLFLAAMNSYRFDTVLRPFPPMFQNAENEKDIKTMQSLVKEVPMMSHLPRQIHKMTPVLLELVKWVLDSKPFTISTCDSNKFEEIKQQTGHTVHVPKPNFIFDVTPSVAAQEKFKHLQNGRKLLYAYHGSRLENFHSILHNGLASHMNKTSVFGEGTYLSGELSVSMIYSPTGVSWDHSELGNRLSCVAVCEMIDDPAVRCQEKVSEDLQRSSSSGSLRSRANAGSSEGGEVPEKYYVVQNNEVLRVRYLLVYAYKTDTHRSHGQGIRAWLTQYRFTLMMVAYFVILCSIGLLSSQTFQTTWRRLFGKYRGGNQL